MLIPAASFLTRTRSAALFLISLLTLATLPAFAQVTVWTQHNDNGRVGANTNETVLKPSNVNQSKFGKLFSYTLDDQTYSQPLYIPNLTMTVDGKAHNVVFVTTVNNSVYAWDADSGSANGGNPLWHQNFNAGGRPPNVQDMDAIGACGGNYHDFAENFGIVSTPVIDTTSNTMYLVARTVENGVFFQRLHALDITSGNEKFGGPKDITATYNGTVFNTDSSSGPSPTQLQNQRAALALMNGIVYIAWSSHCDNGDYHGWVMGYRASDLTQVAAWNTTPYDDNDNNKGGIWQGGQGATIDAQGNLYFLTGNGAWDGVNNFGMSAIQLTTNSSGALRAGQYFTPWNYMQLNNGDTDLGSAGTVLLPGTTILVGGGKEGMLYVMDTTAMGGYTDAPPDNVLQEFQATFIQNGGQTLHIHGGPVFFNSGPDNQYLYLWGENDFLRVFQYTNMSNIYPAEGHATSQAAQKNIFNSTPVAQSTMTAPQVESGMPGGFLSLSSNGTADGIVWALTPHACNANQHVEPGAFFAFDATNFSGTGPTATLTELWDSRQNLARDDVGYFAKFTYPTVANGKVYVGGWGKVPAASENQCADDTAPLTQGQLSVYGLLGQQAVQSKSKKKAH